MTNKKIADLTLDEVFRALKALWAMNEPTTINSLAKDLGVNRIDFFYWVTEANKYHFTIKKDKAEKPYISEFFRNVLDNEANPDWLPHRKTKYPDLLVFTEVEYYGHLGWKLEVDIKGTYGFGWRNTEEKIQAVKDSGILKETTFCFGGLGDSWTETYLGFRDEDKDEIVKKLEAAGWKIKFVD